MIILVFMIFGDGKPDDITFSLDNSNNIQSQDGVFTWNADPTKPFEMVVNEQNNEANKESGVNAHEVKQYVLCVLISIKISRLYKEGFTIGWNYKGTNSWDTYKNCF